MQQGKKRNTTTMIINLCKYMNTYYNKQIFLCAGPAIIRRPLSTNLKKLTIMKKNITKTKVQQLVQKNNF